MILFYLLYWVGMGCGDIGKGFFSFLKGIVSIYRFSMTKFNLFFGADAGYNNVV